MEMYTFLHLLLLITGASSYACKSLGQQCRIEDYPYHVCLVQQLLDDPEQAFGIIDPFRICSGSLIHEQWVLSDGDCYHETELRKPLKVKFSTNLEGLLIKNQTIPHGNIRKFSSDSGDDSIMLVKLLEPVRTNITVHLPASSCTHPKTGQILYSLSYPYRTYDSEKAHLYRVERNITACDTSSQYFFCAEATTTSSPFLPCPSDTGGAILRREESSEVVYGVKISNYKFMDVCAVSIRQWINDTINEL